MHRHGRERLQLSDALDARADAPGRPASSDAREVWALWLLWGVSTLAYAVATAWKWGDPDWKRGPFGLAQLARLGTPGVLAAVVVVVTCVLARGPIAVGLRALGAWVAVARTRRLALGVVLALGALTLPTNNPGGDSGQILREWREFGPGNCGSTSHDEVLEKLVHQWVYCGTHASLGWSLERSFQVSDAVACAWAVALLVGLLLRIAPRAPMLALAVILTGGWSQIYLGDIEVYTLTSVVILAFLDASSRYLAREVGLWVPTLTLTLAMGFHLQAGFLLPVLVALVAVEVVRGHAWRAVGSALTLIGALAGALLALHLHNLPVSELFKAHAFGAGRPFVESLNPLDLAYVLGMSWLLVLLFPGAPLLALLAWRRRLTLDADGWLLVGATACMAFFFWVWRAGFGPIDDWDLFANAMIPSSLLLARTVSETDWSPAARRPLAALLALYAVHTAAWWIANAQPLP